MNVFQPDLVLLELDQAEKALSLASSIGMIRREAVIVGYVRSAPPPADLVREAGVAEILPNPVTSPALQACLGRVLRRNQPEVQDLVAFLPAKAGSGATTLALNVAGSLARDFDRRVLAVDADLHSGIFSVLLKLEADYTLLDALENAGSLDGTQWYRIVVRAHGVDWLVSPKPAQARMVSWANYHQFLQFVRPRYDVVTVDLPEVVNDATAEVVRRARHVFIVTVPELPSLVLARHRHEELQRKGVPAERIGIILNRWARHEIRVEDIEGLLNAPVAAVFRNDYQCVRRAAQEARLIGAKSELGKCLSAFADKLAGAPQPRPIPSFLDSLLARDGPAVRSTQGAPAGFETVGQRD
jgi:pilus assembly protein CpaE